MTREHRGCSEVKAGDTALRKKTKVHVRYRQIEIGQRTQDRQRQATQRYEKNKGTYTYSTPQTCQADWTPPELDLVQFVLGIVVFREVSGYLGSFLITFDQNGVLWGVS